MVTGGTIIGTCFESNLFDEHRILIPPKIAGKVTATVPEGMYTIEDEIMTVEYESQKFKIKMAHLWPVRQTRPCAEKLAGNTPLLTGQRVLDALFPSVLGGTCAIPGGFGCGKTCIS